MADEQTAKLPCFARDGMGYDSQGIHEALVL